MTGLWTFLHSAKRIFNLEDDIKLTNAAADVVCDEATLALVVGDAAERAPDVVADKVWPAVVGAQSALVDV